MPQSPLLRACEPCLELGIGPPTEPFDRGGTHHLAQRFVALRGVPEVTVDADNALHRLRQLRDRDVLTSVDVCGSPVRGLRNARSRPQRFVVPVLVGRHGRDEVAAVPPVMRLGSGHLAGVQGREATWLIPRHRHRIPSGRVSPTATKQWPTVRLPAVTARSSRDYRHLSRFRQMRREPSQWRVRHCSQRESLRWPETAGTLWTVRLFISAFSPRPDPGAYPVGTFCRVTRVRPRPELPIAHRAHQFAVRFVAVRRRLPRPNTLA